MSLPQRSLGRNLSSLIPDSTLDLTGDTSSSSAFRMVPLDEIRPNPEQPRQVFESDPIEELADSLRRHGVLSPLVVRKENGTYVLIAGERRLRAAGLAGLYEVPVIVREAKSRGQQLELALVENLQREDLDAIESARGYRRLMDAYGYTQEEVANRVAKRRATVANALRLLKLPEFLLDAIQERLLSAGHGRALLPITDPDALRRLHDAIIEQQLSVRAVERMVARMMNKPAENPKRGASKADNSNGYATQVLSEALHTNVQIKALKRGGGRIIVNYSDAEDLERLISQMRS